MLARRSLDLAGPCGGALVLELSVRVCDGRADCSRGAAQSCSRVVVVEPTVKVVEPKVVEPTERADGIMELCDSENSVFLTASGGRVVRPCP